MTLTFIMVTLERLKIALILVISMKVLMEAVIYADLKEKENVLIMDLKCLYKLIRH